MIRVYFLVCMMSQGGHVNKQVAQVSPDFFEKIRYHAYVQYPEGHKARVCEEFFTGKHTASWLEIREEI